MIQSGWVKMHRSMLDWEWYSDINVYRLFTHMILKANHKDNKWRGILIKRGQTLTSLNTLESETGLSKSQIRTAVKKLISTREIAQQSHSQHTVFTIVNYDSYQGDDTQNDIPVTKQSHTSDTRVTSNKNDKNENNDKNKDKSRAKRFAPPALPEVTEYFGNRAVEKGILISQSEPEKFIDFYESKNWYVGKNKMKDWKAAARNWLSNVKPEKQDIMQQSANSNWHEGDLGL
mgnify:CR=1 FL=1